MSIDTLINPAELLTDNIRSLHAPGTKRASWADRTVFYFSPIVAGALVGGLGLRFRGVGELLAGAGTLTGVLFGLTIFVFSLRLRVSDDPRFAGGGTTVALVNDLRANVSYAAGTALLLVLTLITAAAVAGDDPLNRGVSGAVTVLVLHLVAVLLLVLKRMKTMFNRLG